MQRISRLVFLCLVWLASLGRVEAFSLLGPATPWQTAVLGYDQNVPFAGFGPMNLGEEYRYNVPTVYYGFTHDFLAYFGQRGAEEIDKAMAILNALPPVSEMDINDFPLGTVRINHRAQALGLRDLKSTALQTMLYQMGLGDPTRFVFTMRKRWTYQTCPPLFHFVIRRNFDPDTLHYSAYINGDLWTYNTIIDSCTTPGAYAVTEPVDPLALLGFRHAPVTAIQPSLTFGTFYTTLTRDDVGALRYIYSPSNYNVENIPPGATNSALGAALVGGSPWSVPTWFLTNGVVTNIAGGGVIGGTNIFEPGTRGGVNKVTFVRANYDSLLGGFFTPVTNVYTDSIVINNQAINATTLRTLAIPDILFDAGDLEGGDSGTIPPGPTTTLGEIVHTAWDNNQDINGLSDPDSQYGPGTVSPATGGAAGLVVRFNKVGPINGNQWPFFVSEADSIASGNDPPAWATLWASFDGSTNEPVIYPFGTSIHELEALVLGGN